MRFCLVGVANTLVYYAVYLLLLWLGIWYIAAATAGTAVGIANSYILNRIFTFKGAASRARGERLRFAVVCLVQYLVNISFVWAFVNIVGMGAGLAGLPSLIVSVAISYLGHKYYTFR